MKNKKMPTAYILVQNRKYPYFISPVKDGVVHFVCEGALIDQDYLPEDIPGLLENLPDMILDEMAYRAEKRKTQQTLRFRVSNKEKCLIEKKSREQGFENTSEFMRSLALKA